MRLSCLIAAALLIGFPSVAFSCNDELCSLNGQCNGNACACYPGWKGPGCSQLDLLPTSPDSGYRPTGRASWGGSILHARDQAAQGKEMGPYFMAVTEFTNNCGAASWKTNSKIVLAASSKPEGPYKYVRDLVPNLAYGPSLTRARDGTIELYYNGLVSGTHQQMECAPAHLDDLVSTSTLQGMREFEGRYFDFSGGEAKLFARYAYFNNSFIVNGDDIEEVMCESVEHAFERCELMVKDGVSCLGITVRPQETFPTTVLFKSTMQIGHLEPPAGTLGWRTWLRVPAFSVPVRREGIKDYDGFWRTISAASGESLFGKFTTKPIFKTSAGHWDDHAFGPDVFNLKNGSQYLAYSSAHEENGGSIGVMVRTPGGEFLRAAPHPAIPKETNSREPYSSTFEAKDPFIWVDKRGHHHMLYHRMHMPFNPAFPVFTGGHAFSRDGVAWSTSPVPAFTSDTEGASGVEVFARRECPKLLLDEDGEILVLATCVEPALQPPRLHYSYTHVQRVRTDRRSETYPLLDSAKFDYRAAQVQWVKMLDTTHDQAKTEDEAPVLKEIETSNMTTINSVIIIFLVIAILLIQLNSGRREKLRHR